MKICCTAEKITVHQVEKKLNYGKMVFEAGDKQEKMLFKR